MCADNYHNIRRSGRLVERWVTITTGRPISKLQTDIPGTEYPLGYKSYLEAIPEHKDTEPGSINRDINLARHTGTSALPSDHHVVAMAEERVANLETDVSTLKSDVGAVNEKLDKLLQSFVNLTLQRDNATGGTSQPPLAQTTGVNQDKTPAASSTGDTLAEPTLPGHAPAQPNQQNRASAGTTPGNMSNSNSRPAQMQQPPYLHHLVGRQLNAEAYIQRELDRDRFEFTNKVDTCIQMMFVHRG